MFEHYMKYQATDPRRRRRLQVALVASGVTTFSLITFMWVTNKMNIARVDPPTISYIMVQMSMDEPPPPPPPPPPPASEQEVEEIPDEEVPLDEIVQPKEIPDKVPETKNMKVPTGVPGGVPGGIPGGMPGGFGGVATKREPPKQVEKKPIQAVMRQGLYTPNPDQKKLQTTKAAMFDHSSGTNKTYFCIDTSGNTTDIRTTQRFPADPQVDQIIVDTIRKWRFKPFMVGSKPIKTCTTYVFEIQFKAK